MKVFWDPIQLSHSPQFFLQRGRVRQNFEVPERAEILLAACNEMGLEINLPGLVDTRAINAVHSANYLAFLSDGPTAWNAMFDGGSEMVPNVHPTPEMFNQGAKPASTIMGQVGWFVADASCPITATTWPSAFAAASCAIAAANNVADGHPTYALTRPPGHHAYMERAGGHCYLNNAAVAAEQLRLLGAKKVAIIDIDSHHGNGTQGIFWDRADVLFASVHGDPNGYYPWYVGHVDELGGGDGFGCNINLPLARNTADAGWLEAIEYLITSIKKFESDALVISLGFDASEHEPLQFLAVTEDAFARAGALIAGLNLKSVIIQEGGYNKEMLGKLLRRFLEGFLSA